MMARLSGKSIPGTYRSFRPVSRIAARWFSSRPHKATGLPERAKAIASAVPNEPAPKTPIIGRLFQDAPRGIYGYEAVSTSFD